MFARWWSTQTTPRVYSWEISMAITARYIMNNDLSRVLAGEPCPYLIWYPTTACESTYTALVRITPLYLRRVVARAAIYCDYQTLFDDLVTNAKDDAVKPEHALLVEAQHSSNPYYRQVIEQRAKELGISLDVNSIPEDSQEEYWQRVSVRNLRSSRAIWKSGMTLGSIYTEFLQMHSVYNGAGCDASKVELYVSIPDDWKPTEEAVEVDVLAYLDYKNWPPHAERLLSRRGQ
jgi:hypothetical protein